MQNVEFFVNCNEFVQCGEEIGRLINSNRVFKATSTGTLKYDFNDIPKVLTFEEIGSIYTIEKCESTSLVQKQEIESHNVEFYVASNEFVISGCPLGRILDTEEIFYAHKTGTLVYDLQHMPKLICMDEIEEGSVFSIEDCKHELIRNSRCLVCLQQVENTAQVNVMFSHGQSYQISVQAAKEMDSGNLQQQYKDRKLTLILDLDHTLLHATNSQGAKDMVDEDHGIYEFQLRAGQISNHYVKLRPHLLELLPKWNTKFDMHIYTHGTREYALEIVKIIDPDGKYFKNRIVARTDTNNSMQKNLRLLFPSCHDKSIVILDDRVDVWKSNATNVLMVQPYHYFEGMADVNNASGPVGQSTGVKSCNDKHLREVHDVLLKIHQQFYANDVKPGDISVQKIMGKLQKQVFENCGFVFSGVIPTTIARKEHHPLWRQAVNFGAIVCKNLEDDRATHLVVDPKRLGTAKYKMAKTKGHVDIVTPIWIVDSVRQWKRCNESEYDVEKAKASIDEYEKQELMKKEELEKMAEFEKSIPPKRKLSDSATKKSSPKKVQFKATVMQIDENRDGRVPVGVKSTKPLRNHVKSKPKPSKPSAIPRCSERKSDNFLSGISKSSLSRKKSVPVRKPPSVKSRKVPAKAPVVSDDDLFAKLMQAENAEGSFLSNKKKLRTKLMPKVVRPPSRDDNTLNDDGDDLDDLEAELFQ